MDSSIPVRRKLSSNDLSRLSNATVDQEDQVTTELLGEDSNDEEQQSSFNKNATSPASQKAFSVLALLAIQNSFKNILMRFVMQEKPNFLLSTAVITVEILKLFFSASYIIIYQKRPVISIYRFVFRDEWKNSLLLAVPASCYIVQMTLEYIAFANIDAASFSVLVQLKMITTALFFKIILGKRLMKKQVMSLVILTVGVMLCNMKAGGNEDEGESLDGDKMKGILATIGITISSGFASVYTEKVIKSARKNDSVKDKEQYGLAYMQCQLALVSLIILGVYALLKDLETIRDDGLFQHFDGPAFLSCFNSAVGGLIVAAVLKHADSVLKGYATAVSVVITGVLSSQLFGTKLSVMFGMGMINVVISVLLFNLTGLEDYV